MKSIYLTKHQTENLHRTASRIAPQAELRIAMTTYKCNFCSRSYQRKLYYSRHITICELMCKSIKERQVESEEHDDTPSVRVLYDVILEMANKISHMERKITELSKCSDVKKRKFNMLTWLNENVNAGQTYGELIGEVLVERRHLEYLFKTDYISGILFVIQEFLPLDAVNAIKAFVQKPYILYVCKGEGEAKVEGEVEGEVGVAAKVKAEGAIEVEVGVAAKGEVGVAGEAEVDGAWSILSEKALNKLINLVKKLLLDDFIKWQTENSAKMEQDDFAIKYAANVIKIMGGNLSREYVSNRIKLDLYKYLKVDIQNTINITD